MLHFPSFAFDEREKKIRYLNPFENTDGRYTFKHIRCFVPQNNFNLKKKRRERINPKLRITSLGLTVRDKKNRGNSWKILSRRRPLAIQIKLIHSFLSDAKGEWQGRGRKLTAFPPRNNESNEFSPPFSYTKRKELDKHFCNFSRLRFHFTL